MPFVFSPTATRQNSTDHRGIIRTFVPLAVLRLDKTGINSLCTTRFIRISNFA